MDFLSDFVEGVRDFRQLATPRLLVWRSRPDREERGSGDSRIMYLYNLTENWCVQSNRCIFN